MSSPSIAPRRPVRPTTPADLWRLAEQGARNGVQLLSEHATGARYATSATKPSVVYYVTERDCTCEGFAYAGRCQHHSLLLAELGWLPDVDDTAAEAKPEPSCVWCGGTGFVVDPDHKQPSLRCDCPAGRLAA